MDLYWIIIVLIILLSLQRYNSPGPDSVPESYFNFFLVLGIVLGCVVILGTIVICACFGKKVSHVLLEHNYNNGNNNNNIFFEFVRRKVSRIQMYCNCLIVDPDQMWLSSSAPAGDRFTTQTLDQLIDGLEEVRRLCRFDTNSIIVL